MPSNNDTLSDRKPYDRIHGSGLWSFEQDEFLKDNYGLYVPREFLKKFREKFPDDLRTSSAIRIRAHLWGIESPHVFSKKEDELIIEMSEAGFSSVDIAKTINEARKEKGITHMRTDSGVRSRLARLARLAKKESSY